MDYAPYPVALALCGKACLLVGSGGELEQRADKLVSAGAVLTVVSSKPSATLQERAQDGRLRLEQRGFDEADLDGCWLAVLTDRDADLAERMARAAEGRQIFFCAIDQPNHNGFAHMAEARAGSLSVAISTAGQAPALARRLRQELERLFEQAGMARFVEQLAKLRRRLPRERRREELGRLLAGLGFTGRLELPHLPEGDDD